MAEARPEIEQRDYQDKAHNAVFRELADNDHQSTLVVMPTGTGKTHVAARIALTRTHCDDR
jgi:superfamily II DNA or RNA helicase